MWRSTFLFKPVLLYPLVMTSASDLQRKKESGKDLKRKNITIKCLMLIFHIRYDSNEIMIIIIKNFEIQNFVRTLDKR